MNWKDGKISKQKAVLWQFLTIEIPIPGENSIIFHVSSSSTTDKLSIKIWTPDGRNLVCSYRDTRIFFLDQKRFFFRIFRTVGIPTHRTQWTIFQGKTGTQIEIFWLRPWWKKLSLYLRRESVWISGRFNIKSTFWNSQTIRILTQGSRNFFWIWISKSVTFPMKTLLNKTKQVVTEKNEHEDPDKH